MPAENGCVKSIFQSSHCTWWAGAKHQLASPKMGKQIKLPYVSVVIKPEQPPCSCSYSSHPFIVIMIVAKRELCHIGALSITWSSISAKPECLWWFTLKIQMFMSISLIKGGYPKLRGYMTKKHVLLGHSTLTFESQMLISTPFSPSGRLRSKNLTKSHKAWLALLCSRRLDGCAEGQSETGLLLQPSQVQRHNKWWRIM